MNLATTQSQKVFTVPVGGGLFTNDAAAVGSGMAFLVGELEKRDPRLLEPLQSVTWQRDIVAKTGGGWVDFTSNTFVDYATTGGNESGIIGGETNDIPIMQANMNKDVYKVFNFANILKVPFVDQQKLQGIGRSLDDILDKGIRLNYNKSIDNVVYNGLPSFKIYGLMNNPVVTAASAANGAISGTPLWLNKTPDEILDDVNAVINATWAASEYDLTGMANHILIPPTQYAFLVGRKVSSAGNISILQFLLENNIGKNQGRELYIAPSRWCTGAGVGSTDRMVAYVNDDDRVNFDLPVPLSRVMTQSQVTEMAYLTAYAAQLGQVKFLYSQCARYVDGI
ncbi:DUF2184 domain-containing protein [Paenibacillus sp. LMG 31456]|uniref:DUF2184 domain-containing protein n=1 Tax=Paenibacillus foliorum TaxID=2654974 RepID=A0A972GXI1_9BACL|nr:DUF2184 domain-containing protein [Paenibacillus foliorum]NOU95597.1 DUF2184 domain-containing protein [Paenibacillus foliorum]